MNDTSVVELCGSAAANPSSLQTHTAMAFTWGFWPLATALSPTVSGHPREKWPDYSL